MWEKTAVVAEKTMIFCRIMAEYVNLAAKNVKKSIEKQKFFLWTPQFLLNTADTLSVQTQNQRLAQCLT